MTQYDDGTDEPMTTARIAGLSEDPQEMSTTAGSAGDATAGPDTDDADDEHAQLLADDELRTVVTRWREIQAEFVDEPRRAVHDADALVADLMQRLATMFAHERAELEARWSSGSAVDTEDLRQGLQRYRTFFERLLAA